MCQHTQTEADLAPRLLMQGPCENLGQQLRSEQGQSNWDLSVPGSHSNSNIHKGLLLQHSHNSDTLVSSDRWVVREMTGGLDASVPSELRPNTPFQGMRSPVPSWGLWWPLQCSWSSDQSVLSFDGSNPHSKWQRNAFVGCSTHKRSKYYSMDPAGAGKRSPQPSSATKLLSCDTCGTDFHQLLHWDTYWVVNPQLLGLLSLWEMKLVKVMLLCLAGSSCDESQFGEEQLCVTKHYKTIQTYSVRQDRMFHFSKLELGAW